MNSHIIKGSGNSTKEKGVEGQITERLGDLKWPNREEATKTNVLSRGRRGSLNFSQ